MNLLKMKMCLEIQYMKQIKLELLKIIQIGLLGAEIPF